MERQPDFQRTCKLHIGQKVEFQNYSGNLQSKSLSPKMHLGRYQLVKETGYLSCCAASDRNGDVT